MPEFVHFVSSTIVRPEMDSCVDLFAKSGSDLTTLVITSDMDSELFASRTSSWAESIIVACADANFSTGTACFPETHPCPKVPSKRSHGRSTSATGATKSG